MKEIKLYNWTSELAYAVGLITTDGSLSKDGRHITLVSSDLQLLRTFRKCLKLKNRITKKAFGSYTVKQPYKITFGNVSLYKWLQKIGLTPNKTFTLGKLAIPKDYLADFLRGYLDGDGSVFTYIDRYMEYKGKRYTYERLYTVLCSASINHLKWIRSNLKEILNIEGDLNSYLRKDRKFPNWKLRFAKKDSLKLLRWLYYKPRLPCLNRKRKIVERVIKIFRDQ